MYINSFDLEYKYFNHHNKGLPLFTK